MTHSHKIIKIKQGGRLIAIIKPPKKAFKDYVGRVDRCRVCMEPMPHSGFRDTIRTDCCIPCQVRIDRKFEREAVICERLMAGMDLAEAIGR